MKATTALMAMLLCICLLTPLSAQENTKGQLWYCYEETVKPAEESVYKELSKELLELCKQNNFPFPIYTWTPGEFKFQLWSPINSLDDIDKIGDAWNEITESWDQEKYAIFNKTKVKNSSFTCRGRKDLHYQPENPRIDQNDVTYSVWQEIYFIPEKAKEGIELIKKMNEKLKSIEYNSAWYFFTGGIGYETPLIIACNNALNEEDYAEQRKKMGKILTEEITELNKKIIACSRTVKVKRMWKLEDLTYEPEK